jgi:hypothetical protein
MAFGERSVVSYFSPFCLITVLIAFISAYKSLFEFNKLNVVEKILFGMKDRTIMKQVVDHLSQLLSAPLSQSTNFHKYFNILNDSTVKQPEIIGD